MNDSDRKLLKDFVNAVREALDEGDMDEMTYRELERSLDHFTLKFSEAI